MHSIFERSEINYRETSKKIDPQETSRKIAEFEKKIANVDVLFICNHGRGRSKKQSEIFSSLLEDTNTVSVGYFGMSQLFHFLQFDVEEVRDDEIRLIEESAENIVDAINARVVVTFTEFAGIGAGKSEFSDSFEKALDSKVTIKHFRGESDSNVLPQALDLIQN